MADTLRGVNYYELEKTMETTKYIITAADDSERETKDYNQAIAAYRNGMHVVEYKEIVTYTGNTVVRLILSTHLTATEHF
jgi:hypothetical protein